MKNCATHQHSGLELAWGHYLGCLQKEFPETEGQSGWTGQSRNQLRDNQLNWTGQSRNQLGNWTVTDLSFKISFWTLSLASTNIIMPLF